METTPWVFHLAGKGTEAEWNNTRGGASELGSKAYLGFALPWPGADLFSVRLWNTLGRGDLLFNCQ